MAGPAVDTTERATAHNQMTLLERLRRLKRPADLDSTYLTHGIHPYAAKYIPQLPRMIIEEHTNERHTVFDPFCGSGTSLLEAALLGRKSIGTDCHPIATLIARAKTTTLERFELEQVQRFATELPAEVFPHSSDSEEIPAMRSLRHWFSPPAIQELAFLRGRIRRMPADNVRQFLECMLSSIIVSVSNQESETRYAAKLKQIDSGHTIFRFKRKLIKELVAIENLSKIPRVRRNPPKIIMADLTDPREIGFIEPDSVDLIVTSPPYPNSYDYYFYHKWRLIWLGFDVDRVKQSEIGSRNEHSSKRAPIETFIDRMYLAFISIGRMLKPSKLAYFFVGDAVIDGQFHDMELVYREISKGTSLRYVGGSNYELSEVTRSFHEKASVNCHGGKKNQQKKQHVLVFEKVNSFRMHVSGSGVTRAKATPVPIATRVSLGKNIANGSMVSLRSADNDRHIHSLGRYPSRFIPEISRWAVSEFSRGNDIVLDPFVGCGTTAVEAIVAGRHAIAADFSPYACLLTRAKTTFTDARSLVSAMEAFNSVLENPALLPFARGKTFHLDTFWFNPSHLDEFARLRRYVDLEVPCHLRDFYLAVISTVIRPCSFQDQGQIKVKRDPKKVLNGTLSPITLLKDAHRRYATRLLSFNVLRQSPRVPEVYCQTATDLGKSVSSNFVDLIVTSPPYINAMNYPMTHRYENLLLGLVPEDRKVLHEEGYFGTERVYAREYSSLKTFPEEFPEAKAVNDILAKIFIGEPKRSYIAFLYFANMWRSIITLGSLLKPGGRMVLVAGHNTIRGVEVDTFRILCNLIENTGLSLEKKFHYEIIKNSFKLTRHKTANIIDLDGVGVFRKIGS